jgi:hypothetical protein
MKEYVLMADVIGSSDQDSSKLMKDFKSLVSEANKKFNNEISSPLTITLGDEFQGIVKNLKTGIEVMIFIEEKILEKDFYFKLRYILNEGEVETKINKDRAYGMLGNGLTFARKILNSMKKENNRFQIFLDNSQLSTTLFRLFMLLQYFLDSWNPKDISTVAGFLEGLDYKELAKQQSKDPSSLWRRRKSLAIDEYQTCKQLIMDTING